MQLTVRLLNVVRSAMAGGDVYAGQQFPANEMYAGQPMAMSMASYQGYVISKDAVNAATAAAPVPPISSM